MERFREIRKDNIEPLCILRTLARHGWLAAVNALTFFLAATLAAGLLYPPRHAARATLVVSSRAASSFSTMDTSTANSVAATFTELMGSDLMRSRVSRAAGLSSFDGGILIENTSGTNLITITVSSSSARDSFLVLRTLLSDYNDITGNAFQGAVFTILNEPSLSDVSTLPMALGRLQKLSALTGAALVLALLCYYAVARGTVQTERGAKEALDAVILSSVPHERLPRGRRGQEIRVTAPTISYGFHEALQKLSARLEQHKEAGGSKVFLLGSVAEHEGKSTIADNLALALCSRHKNVLVMDCDLRKPSRFAAVSGSAAWKSVYQYQVGSFSLDLISDESATHFALFSREAPENPTLLFSHPDFKKLLANLRNICSYILIDSPPLGLFSDGERLADLADASLLVVRQDLVPAPAVNDAVDTLRGARASFLGCVLNDMYVLPFTAPATSSSGYGYGYGYGYGKYGKYGYGRYEGKARKQSEREGNA